MENVSGFNRAGDYINLYFKKLLYSEGEMEIEEIRTKILEWCNFYGQDIVQTDLISKAKTKKELLKIIKNHRRFLED